MLAQIEFSHKFQTGMRTRRSWGPAAHGGEIEFVLMAFGLVKKKKPGLNQFHLVGQVSTC